MMRREAFESLPGLSALRFDFEVLQRVRLDCADPINNSLRLA
jgi:hypothetical protein